MSATDQRVEITIDQNVYHLDRDAEIVLIQISQDHYQVRKGRWHIGDVTFCNGSIAWGWIFQPRSPHFRPNRRLGAVPEAVLPRSLKVNKVISQGCYDRRA